jgi:hypothetical protein
MGVMDEAGPFFPFLSLGLISLISAFHFLGTDHQQGGAHALDSGLERQQTLIFAKKVTSIFPFDFYNTSALK